MNMDHHVTLDVVLWAKKIQDVAMCASVGSVSPTARLASSRLAGH